MPVKECGTGTRGWRNRKNRIAENKSREFRQRETKGETDRHRK